jgi:hypothetical protein
MRLPVDSASQYSLIIANAYVKIYHRDEGDKDNDGGRCDEKRQPTE